MKHIQGIYFKYFRFVLKHKWYVLLECFKKGEYIRGISHDNSKFSPDEFIPYARYFYLDFSTLGLDEIEDIKSDFNNAWLLHIHRNPHHWQHWVLHEDCGNCIKLDMPDMYIREMVSDWKGAGKAIHGKDDVIDWYEQNKNNMLLSSPTRYKVKELVAKS